MREDKKASEQTAGKPAWFQLVDSDAPSAQVSKVDKKLPLIALIVTGVIAVSGTFFATASEQNQGLNNSNASVGTNAISDVVDTNNGSGATTSATPVNSTLNITSPVAPANGLQNPAQGGVTAPRGDHEDDDDDDRWGWLPGHDDDDDDDEDDDDDDEEREERH